MKRTLTIFTLLLVTEIAIAVFHFHKFIRGFVGDVLVIPLLFYFLRLFTKLRTWYLVAIVLTIGIGIEYAQYTGVFQQLQSKSTIWSITLGTTFDWNDILAYCLGAIIILLFENRQTHEKN